MIVYKVDGKFLNVVVFSSISVIDLTDLFHSAIPYRI